jgi:RNA polymerase sigma-70 factor (ECF subfamily)
MDLRRQAAPGDDPSGEAGADDAAWLHAFHRGDRSAMERCYRDHFETVEAAIGGILGGADRETVIHELFSRLLANEDLRRSFHGGSLGAWLAMVGRNQAIDYRRRFGRETDLQDRPADAVAARWQDAADARMLIERFKRESLPPAWVGVFDLCFVQQMSQREAARALGIRRTTLAYREIRIRRELRKFLLEDESP